MMSCPTCGLPCALDSNPLYTILERIAAKHGMKTGDLIAEDKRRPIVNARWEFFYTALVETAASYPTIGKVIKRDHTSVAYGAAMWAVNNNLPTARNGGLDWRAKQRRNREFSQRRKGKS